MRETSTTDIIADTRTICDVVGTTLGPFGRNQMIIQESGNISITSSAVDVFNDLDISTPAVTLLTEAVNGFDARYGDGTTSVALLTGAFLEETADLLEQGLHPTTIERGFNEALEVATIHLEERSHPLSLVGSSAVATTALTGTRDPTLKHRMGTYLADVAESIAEEIETGTVGRANRVKVNSRIGMQGDTELVRGLVLDRKPIKQDMPRSLSDVGVALLSETLDPDRFTGSTSRADTSATVSVESFDEQAAIREGERERFREQVQTVVDAGCRFVATTGGVNDQIRNLLSNSGLTVIDKVDEGDIRRLVQATGAQVVPSISRVATDTDTLGTATVSVKRKAGRDFTYIEAEGNEPVFTLFCRAPDPRSVGEFERSVENALAAVWHALEDDQVVPGGGAIEISLSNAVREHARSNAGREQLAMNAFADGLTKIPRVLAVNAGMDGWAGVLRLRLAHDEGRSTTGIDAIEGSTANMLDDDPVVEPTRLKKAILGSATETAVKLARIDAELPANDLGGSQTDDAVEDAFTPSS